jgi:tripartite-type tricarboxylate transporter receptor subunit TctC
MEQLKVAAKLDIVHVPYRGIGPAITDILGGQTQALFPGLAAALPHIKAGKMKPLAVTGTRRHPLLPDVPTFDESGYKGFDGVQWCDRGPGELAGPIVNG